MMTRRFQPMTRALLDSTSLAVQLLVVQLSAIFLLVPSLLLTTQTVSAQQPPYDVVPDADPPYYRVRYEASTEPGQLDLAVQYTIWIPPHVDQLRGVVVHQHGCGEGSCKSGLTGAFDLHWQALAMKHGCALLSPSYEQPQDAECQRWCDPRNGSDARFQQSLIDLGKACGHPELSRVPWALWGHSGGGHWAGVMTLLHADRVAAAWLRSGVPLVVPRPDRPNAKTVDLPTEPLSVPVMLNLGTEEGVTVTDGRFSKVWPAVKRLFDPIRQNGGLIGIAVDPLTGHQCGNQRYLAIPWFDECLAVRLPTEPGGALRPMPNDQAWLAAKSDSTAVPQSEFPGDKLNAIWLPNQRIAKAWMQYVRDTAVTDTSFPPAPKNLEVAEGILKWQCSADLESGIAYFIVQRNGTQIATVPEKPKNPFGRPLFQGLQYSDTPSQPLVKMTFRDPEWTTADQHQYRIISVNTVGLQSQ